MANRKKIRITHNKPISCFYPVLFRTESPYLTSISITYTAVCRIFAVALCIW